MTTKICNTCKKEFPIENFGINRKPSKESNNFHSANVPHYKGDCKPCLAKKAKKWRTNNKGYIPSGKITKYSKEERLIVSAIRDRITTARSNNKRYPNRIFDLDADYLYELLKKQDFKCALTGVKLLIEKNNPLGLSIDKIIPNKGYIHSNIQWVCWAANRAKGDLTMEDFLGLCRSVLRRCNDYPKREYT